jgi:hypothetical protein
MTAIIFPGRGIDLFSNILCMFFPNVSSDIYWDITPQRPRSMFAIPVEPNPPISQEVLSRFDVLTSVRKAIFLTMSCAILSPVLTMKG